VNTSKNGNGKVKMSEQRLLEIHRLHLGLYARVANTLSLSPSYVSLVASGSRHSEKVRRALVKELAKIQGLR
jgi:hypothetical protein